MTTLAALLLGLLLLVLMSVFGVLPRATVDREEGWR